MLDAAPLLVVIAAIGITWLTLRRRSGVARPHDGEFTPAQRRDAGLDARRPTFVVFTAPGCSTCGPTRSLVENVAQRHAVAVVTLDATQHEDLAAAHRVLRAPTTFLVQPDGRITGRIVGLPRPLELAGLLAAPSREVGAAA